jgi:hypothetical protein
MLARMTQAPKRGLTVCTVRSPAKRRILLDAIARGATILEATQAAGMSRRSFFNWVHADPEFEADYRAAFDDGSDVYEAELHRRALSGESDAALIFTLKSRDPGRFNRKQVEVSVGGNANAPPVSMNVDGAIDHTVGRARVIILPDNNRPSLSETEIQTEREAVERESMIGSDVFIEAESDG